MTRPLLGLTGILISTALLLTACAGGAPAAPTVAPKAETKAAAKPVGESAASPVAAKPAAASPVTASKAAVSPAAGNQVPVGSGKASGDPIKVGHLNDRSGPTASVGSTLGDAIQKWVELANNTQGGVKGRPVEAVEVDIKYEVPLAVDAYKKLTTRDQVPTILGYGTPMTEAIAPSAIQDHVVLWIPGIGLSESVDGERFPYIFPAVATYKAQAAAVMDYIARDWQAQGKAGQPKVIYSYFDNPAGRDPLALIETEAQGIGLDLIDTVGVPGTTIDLTTIMTQIKDKNPDYLMTHYFGRMPALSLQAAEKVGIPREKMISLVWGITNDEIELAKSAVNGYRGIQFTALYPDQPEAYRLMSAYLQASGQTIEPKKFEHVQWARGMAMSAIMLDAMRLADDPTQGESVKKGAESLRDYTAYGLYAPTTITPQDHGGTRKVQMYEVRDLQLVRIQDWFEGPKTPSETGS